MIATLQNIVDVVLVEADALLVVKLSEMGRIVGDAVLGDVDRWIAIVISDPYQQFANTPRNLPQPTGPRSTYNTSFHIVLINQLVNQSIHHLLFGHWPPT